MKKKRGPDEIAFRLDNDELASERFWAKKTEESVRTWQNRRATGGGPPYIKLGRNVRYRKSDVLAWLQENARSSIKRK